jgi:hypothetical protein
VGDRGEVGILELGGGSNCLHHALAALSPIDARRTSLVIFQAKKKENCGFMDSNT